ncbi:MAG: serine/threonine-protein kinase [Myxococcales bacterium]
MAEQVPKARWGMKPKAVEPERTLPESTLVAGPEASAQGEGLAAEQPGHFELKREIGRGSQALVFVAHDRHMGRDVAFKQLLPGGPRNSEDRFLREARVAGQLEHPGVVAVHEVGRRSDGSLYCAMRLVRGRSLADAFKENRGRARLQLLSNVVQLCQTIAYAHERGVIHRDVKPENVMLGPFGETILLDWGVAKLRGNPEDVSDHLRAPDVSERFDATQEGDVIGTPAYMSPEQALGNVKEIDEQSDVWSLGAVLYELLTGNPPYTEKNAVQLLIKIAKDKYPPVLTVAPDTPRELALICERALERNKKRRYRSAAELASDIEAFRAGGRVSGIEYSSLQLARKWVQRNFALAIACAVAFVLLLGAGARIWLENREARRYLAQALLEKSEQEAHEQRWSRAGAYAAAARVQDDTAEARWRAAQRGPVEIDPVWRVELPWGVDAIAISRNGSTIAVALADHSIKLFDQKAAVKQTLEGESKAIALTFSPDGQTLISATDDKQLLAWTVDSGDRVRLDSDARIRDVEFSPDGAVMATATADGFIRLWSTDGWQAGARLDGHDGAVTSVDFSADSTALVSSGEDGTLRLWSPINGDRVRPAMKMIRGEGHQPANRAAFVAAGEVVSASNDGTVRFFSIEGQQLSRINTTHGAIVTLAAPAKGAIAALGQDGIALLVDPAARALAARLEGDDSVSAIALSADGSALVSANRDGRLRLWRVQAGAHDVRLQGARDFPGGTALAVSQDGQRVAIGDAAGHIAIWDLSKARVADAMDLLQGPVTGVAFSRDARYLAASGHEEKAFLFVLAHGDRVPLEGHSDLVNCVAFAPDGNTVATGSSDGTVRLWTVPEGRQARVLSATGMGAVLTVAYSGDGKLLAAAGEDKAIRIWELKTGRVLHRMDGPPDAVLTVAFSPHASLVASAGRDQAIRTWRVGNGKLRSTWLGHGARVWSIAFAPDGETLASASADGTIRFWDVLTGRQVTQLDRTPEARAIAFTPEGQLLISTAASPAVQITEIGDKALLLAPGAELRKQLDRDKLKLDGIRLVDDVDALAPAPAKPARRRR